MIPFILSRDLDTYTNFRKACRWKLYCIHLLYSPPNLLYNTWGEHQPDKDTTAAQRLHKCAHRPARHPESGICKRKQESKKTRKQELDQESDQEKKKVFFSFFWVVFSFSWLLSWSSSCFLFFLIAFLVEFFFSFINSHLWSSLQRTNNSLFTIIAFPRKWPFTPGLDFVCNVKIYSQIL